MSCSDGGGGPLVTSTGALSTGICQQTRVQRGVAREVDSLDGGGLLEGAQQFGLEPALGGDTCKHPQAGIVLGRSGGSQCEPSVRQILHAPGPQCRRGLGCRGALARERNWVALWGLLVFLQTHIWVPLLPGPPQNCLASKWPVLCGLQSPCTCFDLVTLLHSH